MTKKEYIETVLIVTAQETVWKNELAKAYALQSGMDQKEIDEKVKACDHAIEKDKKYLAFLNEQCESLE